MSTSGCGHVMGLAANTCRSRSFYIMISLLVIGTGWTYAPIWDCDFCTVHDMVCVSGNAVVLSGFAGRSWWWSLRNVETGLWMPLSWLSLISDSSLWGPTPRGYHLTNLCLHLVNVPLVVAVLSKATDRPLRSVIAGALFGLHPVNVATVARISHRPLLLASCFGLLSLYLYLVAERTGRRGWMWASFLAFLGALLSHPFLAMLPMIFLLFHLWPMCGHRQRKLTRQAVGGTPSDATRATLRGQATGLAVSGIWAIARSRWLRGTWPFLAASSMFSLIAMGALLKASQSSFVSLPQDGSRVAQWLLACLGYLEKLVWPRRLAAGYYDQSGRPPAIAWCAAAIVLAAVTRLSAKVVTRTPAMLIGWGWYVCGFLPFICIPWNVPAQLASGNVYFASVGVFLAAVWGVAEVVAAGKRMLRVGAYAGTLVGIVALSACSRAEVAKWESTVSVYQNAIGCDLANPTAEAELGTALLVQKRCDEAIEHLEAAIRFNPEMASAHFDLGMAWRLLGHPSRAIDHFKRSLSDHALRGTADLMIAEVYFEADDYAMARSYIGQALASKLPGAAPLELLARICEEQSDFRGAVLCRKRVLELDASQPQAHLSLALDYRHEHDLKKAIAEFELIGDNEDMVGAASLELARTLSMSGNVNAARSLLEGATSDPTVAEEARSELAALNGEAVDGPISFARLSPNWADELLIDRLNAIHRDVTTGSQLAQRYFDQGLAYLYSFDHTRALRSFKAAAANDSKCAMAFWGIAMANGPEMNMMDVSPARQRAGWRAAVRAVSLSERATPIERALIEAVARRFSDPPTEAREGLDEAYADAMRQVVRRFPTDADVGALTAEAIMDLHPWDLWTLGGNPKDDAKEIQAILQAVLTHNSHHLFAEHLWIHFWEPSPYPQRAQKAADDLRTAAPPLAHLMHMPSHLYVRMGRWKEAVEVNEKAIEVEKATGRVVRGNRHYSIMHEYHMLAYAASMLGNSEKALAATRDIVTALPYGGVPRLRNETDMWIALPYKIHLRFGQWDAMLAEPCPSPAWPIAQAFWRYARGIAFAATGLIESAKEEQAAFLKCRAGFSDADRVRGIPVADLLGIADFMLSGEILYREGKTERAITDLTAAVRKEDGLKYTEPPAWIIPARHALAAILLDAGRLENAERVYRDDLTRNPGNGWSLYGLAKSLQMQGRTSEAMRAFDQFREAWRHADLAICSSCLCVKHVGEDGTEMSPFAVGHAK
jgi:tetratricopeptide (TPR) repeat protein